MSIGGHHTTASTRDEWLTPPEILLPLCSFDLDPCASIQRPWPTATRHLTVEDDGLSHEWSGRVWLNPPYGSQTAHWLDRMADHNDGIALVFARTETAMFFSHVWLRATAMLFLEGRLHFCSVEGFRASGNAGAPSVLIAYGEDNAEILRASGLRGAFVSEWTVR